MKHLVIYLFFLLAATSCGLSGDNLDQSEEDVELLFSIEIPENKSVVTGVRSISDDLVRCLDVLVFDQDNKFQERVVVNEVSGSSSTKTFRFRTKATTTSRTFHIIANGRDGNNVDIINFNEVTTGMLENIAIPLLKTKVLTTQNSPSLPLFMWGRTSIASISSATTIGAVNMLRTVAATTVSCLAATANNGLSDFTLTGFTILKSSDQARIAPVAYTLSATIPTTVSLVDGSGYIDYINTSGSGVWSLAKDGVCSDLYMYERRNVLDNTGLSVIIKGTYKGEECYYKIWLSNSSGQAIDIVRNHRYLIQISKVFGIGYTSLEKAITSDYSSNIFLNIVDNNDDIVDIIADGKHELGVSSPFTMVGSGSATIGVVLSTNTSESVAISSSDTWLNQLELSGSGNRKTITGNFDVSSQVRSATITIKCGNLERKLLITQNPS